MSKTYTYYDESASMESFLEWFKKPHKAAFDEITTLNSETKVLSSTLFRNGRQVGFSYSTKWPMGDEDE